MQSKFMISYKDRKLGPLTESQIRKMLAGKQIQPTDYFFDDEKQDWVPLFERFVDGAPPAQTAPSKDKPAPPPPNKKQSDEFPKNPPRHAMLLPENNDFEVLEVSQEPTPPAQELDPVKARPAVEKTPPAPVVQAAAPTANATAAPTPSPMPKPGPKPTAKPAAVVSTSAPASTANKIRLDGGVGTLSLTQVKAGPVSLHLKSNSGMELPMEIKVTIQAAPASQVRIEVPEDCRAGEEISLKLSALDAYDNVAVDFDGTFEILMIGKKKESHSANFDKGLATVSFKPTCAEMVSFQVKESNRYKVTLPAPVDMKVHPNEPVKLIAEAPQEVRAGENINLKITALDAYGNVVSDFKGEIDLNVEATSIKKVS